MIMAFDFLHGDIPERISAASNITLLTNAAALIAVVIAEGNLLWKYPLSTQGVYVAILTGAFVSVLYRFFQWKQVVVRSRFLKRIWFESLLLVLMLVLITDRLPFVLMGVLRALVMTIVTFKNTRFGERLGKNLSANPAKVFAFSFLVLILTGAVLLYFPRATTDLRGASFLNALFTSASAACVTGLVVLNTNAGSGMMVHLQTFSTFGQVVILVLMQVGGLGIMTLSTAAVVLVGGKLSFRDKKMISSMLDEDRAVTLMGLVKRIVIMSLAFESVGALLMGLRFLHYFSDSGQAAYYGIFHAVSAFNNAGFSLFPTSLTAFDTDPVIMPVISLLIVFGGLGFAVVNTIFSPNQWKQGFRQGIKRLPIHTKIVLISTTALIFGGMVLLLIFDYNGSMAGIGFGRKVVGALFQSISARTTGFNSLDISQITRSAALVFVLLMFVGASPGGTGGGIKTTTVVVFLASLRSMLRGREEIEVFHRRIAKSVVQKAVAVTALAFTFVMGALLLLLATQPKIPTVSLMFETFSAFGTVGLSMGATTALNPFGKWVIIILMYVGRIGPVTLALAVAEKHSKRGVSYPEGKVVVG